MGLSAAAAERRDAAVHQLHPVEEQGDGRLQDCRPSRAGQVPYLGFSLTHPTIPFPALHQVRVPYPSLPTGTYLSLHLPYVGGTV